MAHCALYRSTRERHSPPPDEASLSPASAVTSVRGRGTVASCRKLRRGNHLSSARSAVCPETCRRPSCRQRCELIMKVRREPVLGPEWGGEDQRSPRCPVIAARGPLTERKGCRALVSGLNSSPRRPPAAQAAARRSPRLHLRYRRAGLSTGRLTVPNPRGTVKAGGVEGLPGYTPSGTDTLVSGHLTPKFKN